MTKEELQLNIDAARAQLAEAETALAAFVAAPENNVFASVEEASDELEERLSGQARDDCQGAHNCGADEYTQEFIVDGVIYIATYRPEYNRHDKTYYYVEEAEFSVLPK